MFVKTRVNCNWIIRREAAQERYSQEKVFWKYAASLQENNHAEVWFQDGFFRIRHGCFHVNLLHIFGTPFYKNTSDNCFCRERIKKKDKFTSDNICVSTWYITSWVTQLLNEQFRQLLTTIIVQMQNLDTSLDDCFCSKHWP